jgi:hypothetical protein
VLDGGFTGLLNYGRQILFGLHLKDKCKNCGEIRYKSKNWRVVKKELILDKPKQMTFQ